MISTDASAIVWEPPIVIPEPLPYITTSSITIGTVPKETSKLTIEKVGNGYIVREKGEELLVFNDFYDMCNHIREEFGEPDPKDLDTDATS